MALMLISAFARDETAIMQTELKIAKRILVITASSPYKTSAKEQDSIPPRGNTEKPQATSTI
jgi:hypothetical protein